MKKIYFLISAVILISQTSCAQKSIKGNGNVVQDSRQTESYDKITLIGSAKVELIKGTEGKLTVSAESNILPYVETVVKGNELIVKFKDNFSYSSKKGVKITVPIQEISDLKLKGSGDIIGTNLLNLDDLNLHVNGSGDISLNVNCQSVKAEVNGSGDILLKGKANELKGMVNGSGDLKSKELTVLKSELKVNGSGDIDSTTTNEVDAYVFGSGDIRIYGNPTNVTQKVQGSGDISISKK